MFPAQTKKKNIKEPGVFIELDYDDGSSCGLTMLLDPAVMKSWVEKTKYTN